MLYLIIQIPKNIKKARKTIAKQLNERRAKNVPDTTDFLRRYGMFIDDYNWITRH